MKKYLLIIVSILVLASCAKNEVVGSKTPRAVGFSTYVGKSPESKGTEINTIQDIIARASEPGPLVNVPNNFFGITMIEAPATTWALNDSYATWENVNEGNIQFIPVQVTGEGLTLYDMDGTKEIILYWPDDDAQILQFYAMWPAVSPYRIVNSGMINPYPIEIFPEVENQIDYLFARNQGSYSTNGNKAIKIAFQHVMSKLNVSATIADLPEGISDVVVTALKIGSETVNFKDRAKVELTEDAGIRIFVPTPAEPENSNDPNPGPLAPFAFTLDKSVAESSARLTDNLFVAPEKIDIPIEITYNINYEGVNPVVNTVTENVTLGLDLKQGKAYMIELVLPLNNIETVKFSVLESEDWDI